MTDESLEISLEELAKTAGAVTVGRLIARIERMIHPGTYLGKGKLEELAFLISEASCNRYHL